MNATSASSSNCEGMTDIQCLRSLQEVYSAMLQDCIAMTDWKNPQQVSQNKQLLFQRICKSTLNLFSAIGGIPSHDSAEKQAQISEELLGEEEEEEEEQGSFFQDDDYIPHKKPKNNNDQKQQQQQQLLKQIPKSKQLESSFFDDINDSDEETENLQQHQQHRKRNFERQIAEQINSSEPSSKPKQLNVSATRTEFVSTPNTNTKPMTQNVSNGNNNKNNSDPGIAQNLTLSSDFDKERVLKYFMDNYDPGKRNKMEVINQIVTGFSFTYTSVYHIVSTSSIVKKHFNQQKK